MPKFRINLSNGRQTLLSGSESDILDQLRSTFLAIGLRGGENLVRGHGDTFTLTGTQGEYLRRLIQQNPAFMDISIIPNIPDVTGLELTPEGSTLLEITWTPDNRWYTDVEIMYSGEGEWTSLGRVDPGLGYIPVDDS